MTKLYYISLYALYEEAGATHMEEHTIITQYYDYISMEMEAFNFANNLNKDITAYGHEIENIEDIPN